MNRLMMGYNMKFILSKDNLKRLKYLIKEKNKWKTYNDSNDIIELHILSYALKYNKSQLLESDIIYDQSLPGKAIKIIVTFFNSKNLEYIFENLKMTYIPFFWNIISKYNITMDPKVFNSLSKNKNFKILDVLIDKKLSSVFSNQIVKYVLNHPKFVENIIIDIARNNKLIPHYYPEKIKNEYMDELVNNYLKLPRINPNVLYFLINSKPHTFKISNKTYIKVIKKQESIYEYTQKHGITLENKIFITFGDKNKTILLSHKYDSFSIKQIYNKKLLFGIMTYIHLLSNFQNPFEFVDKTNDWTCVSNINEIDALERVLAPHSEHDYIKDSLFDYINMFQDTIVKAYNEYLSKNDINLEKIIKSYFELYLPTQLNIHGFYFNSSSPNTTYLEKCRNLLIEQESLLHQFQFYYNYGKVNKRYISFVSGPIDIESIPSFKNEYIYYNSEHNQVTAKIVFMLFSNQNNLLYDVNKNPKYNTTYEVLLNYRININNIADYNKSSINFLIDHEIIQIKENGIIYFDKKLLELMNYIYFKGSFNSILIKNNYKNQINFLKEHDMISFSDKLLSPNEQKYFKFMLNNQDFTNSRMIRNNYIHGNSPNNYNQIERDYFTILRITILLILKMNSEFVYTSSQKSKNFNAN